jgi:hypothetical protein
MVGRECLTKGDRRLESDAVRHEAIVDPETPQRGVDVRSKGVRTGSTYQCGALTEPRGGDRDIRWAPAEEFLKVLDVNETAVLRWVEIDADAADGDHVKWFVHDRT